MSTYYEYQDVKVKIAHRLMNMDGWTVSGYHADKSDIMTDYWSPAYWNGIAEKNGYKLVVDHSTAQEERTYTYTKYNTGITAETREKIAKLEQMTQERGASEQEEQTARAKIKTLRNKAEEGKETVTVIEHGHLANPPRCNWHIEKDGIIYDKGTGLLKFYRIPDITDKRELKDWQEYNNKTPEQWKNDYVKWLEMNPRYFNHCDTEEERREMADRQYKEASEKFALLEKFNLLIARFNNVCGGMVGNAGTDTYTYEEVTVTEYKTELKPKETATGSIREGQCFILKTGFNYNCYKGLVYRIHETDYKGSKHYHAYKLNRKYTKECTGRASSNNYWSIGTSDDKRFLKWIEKGAIAWCELEEVKTPYEVKKVVKKYNKATQEATEDAQTAPEETAAEEPTEAPENTVESATESENGNTEANADTANTNNETELAAEEPTTAEDAAPETAEASEELKQETTTSEETATEQEEAEQDPPPISDMFAELAKAYVTGKQIPKKTKAPTPTPPQEEQPKEETATATAEAEEEPTPEEPQQEPLSSDKWSAEEIARLTAGQKVIKKYEQYTSYYISIKDDVNAPVWHLYKQENYRHESMRIGKGGEFTYAGFIYNGRVYTDEKRANNAFTADINERMKQIIPDEQTAIERALEIGSEWVKSQIDDFTNADYTKEARKYFYEGKTPELILYTTYSYKMPSTWESALYYITQPKEAIANYADIMINDRQAEIAKTYIRYNRITAELEAIKADSRNIAHTLKRISESIHEEKTVRVKTATGEIYRIKGSDVRRMPHWGYISKYDISGRDTDIQPEEIAEIMHGNRILYKAS